MSVKISQAGKTFSSDLISLSLEKTSDFTFTHFECKRFEFHPPSCGMWHVAYINLDVVCLGLPFPFWARGAASPGCSCEHNALHLLKDEPHTHTSWPAYAARANQANDLGLNQTNESTAPTHGQLSCSSACCCCPLLLLLAALECERLSWWK